MQVAARLTPFNTPNLSLQVVKKTPISQNSFHYNYFLFYLKKCLPKKNCLYIDTEKNKAKNKINELVSATDSIINFYLNQLVYIL